MLIHPQLLSRPIAKSDESMRKKATYRIRNWNKYNKALIKRGSLTFWFDEEAIAPPGMKRNAQGGAAVRARIQM